MDFSYSELNFALQDLVPWEVFSTYLPGITQADIEKIQIDEPRDVAKQKMALVSKWLKVFPGASWSDVVKALKKAEENKLALEIESKYVTRRNILATTSGIKNEHTSTPPYTNASQECNVKSEPDKTKREELKEGNLRFENTKLTMIKVASSMLSVASSMRIVASLIILVWLLTYIIPPILVVSLFLYFFFIYNFEE